MKRAFTIIFFLLFSLLCSGQGYNHQWLLGNYNFVQDPKGRMYIDTNSYNIIPEFRKMPFYGTQGNISDTSGNLLMASNGVWIANATGDTMMNGSGINPGGITPNWPNGLAMIANNVIIPFPDDSSKFIMLHHTGYANVSNLPLELFYTVIDINEDGGLGGVILKNAIAFTDTLNWGIGVCRHGNGRDWWAVMIKENTDSIYSAIIDNTGISNINIEKLNYSPNSFENVAQLTFSPDGTKFISTTYDNIIDRNSFIVISDFNRCTGDFSNTQSIQLTSGSYLWGLAFSPSGKYAYACSSTRIFQIDTDTYSVDTVANYDGFISPGPACCNTTFWNMYLAANGKIYITSGSSVRHFTEINYPDSAGLSCDVQQHAVFIGNYAHLRAVPNHPNYYLGCDTTLGCPCLTTGYEEVPGHDFKFTVSPNPSQGFVKIIYLLPQNKSGHLDVFDITGKRIYSQPLPPWSTLQQVDLSFLRSGLYNCVISSGDFRSGKKVAIMGE